jgi:hypothetical protein
MCQFLEPGTNPYELVIRLDGKSSNPDANAFGSLLKEPYGFKNLYLIYDYKPDKQINFLSLKNIYDVENNKIIQPEDLEWKEYLSSGYFELSMIMTLQHGLWHLMSAYITCIAKENIIDKELVKVFTMCEQNIFVKANEVKTFFLQSPMLFNTILYGNPAFMEYSSQWINGFVNNFSVDTYFETNILRGLNPNQQWVPGFKENLILVKDFSKSIIANTDNKYHWTNIWSWNCYQNINPIDRTIRVEQLIQINLTIGSILHSQTFEYQKLGFTELIYNDKIPKSFFPLLLSTLEWNIAYPIYGNYEYYVENKYQKNFEDFSKNIVEIRKIITKQIKDNKIFKSFTYTNVFDSIEHNCINTWNTRV